MEDSGQADKNRRGALEISWQADKSRRGQPGHRSSA